MTKRTLSIFTHKSRINKIYYIHRKKTKKGNISYYLSPKEQGDIIERLPNGYEIYDHPETNQPFIRPIPPKIIFDNELTLINNFMSKYSDIKHYRIDAQKNTIVIYTAENQKPVSEVFANLFNIPLNPELDHLANLLKSSIPDFPSEIVKKFLRFHPMLCFILKDNEERTFAAQRWCFKGKIDNWIDLLNIGPLEDLCRTFFPHLNRDSFYELPFNL